jgi:hypothetical protein
MKHYFGGILRRIYEPSKKFFIKSPYTYLSKCTDPLKSFLSRLETENSFLEWIFDHLEAQIFFIIWTNIFGKDNSSEVKEQSWKTFSLAHGSPGPNPIYSILAKMNKNNSKKKSLKSVLLGS